ncbi:hypothetical protein AgCh_010303 [Apium graveolens]
MQFILVYVVCRLLREPWGLPSAHPKEQLDRLDSLPWHSSLPEFTSTDDTFSIVSSTNELDGGFLSLEEIVESAYGLEIPKFEEEVKSKKQKTSESGNVGGDGEEGVGDVEDEGESGGEEDKEVKSTNKKMKKRSRKKKKVEEKREVVKVVAVSDVPEEDAFEDGEFHAWNELRLYPLIMKSIYRLKFKEPTPIQKACIPADAHQGKDVIEREKADNVSIDNSNAGAKIAASGFLRALTITPTREIALQVINFYLRIIMLRDHPPVNVTHGIVIRYLVSPSLVNNSEWVEVGDKGYCVSRGVYPVRIRKEIPKFEEEVKSKKRKASESGNVGGNDEEGVGDVEDEGESGGQEEKEVKSTNKKMKKMSRKKKIVEEKWEVAKVVAVLDVPEEDAFEDGELYAWNELRLHPLIMKSIYRLKFKEPTPIQKACIPATAHQGKDVIGATKTGSGKTLAFGLPILQRLLEEREKTDNVSIDNRDAGPKIATRGFLRALIITLTRELALQVHGHLKEVAKDTNIRVVPMVGGMSTQKQERLLKARPEIVVGTLGRLWELMSGGQIHLVEMHSLSFFVLDDADRMIENGHFHELQSIIDMLPGFKKTVKGNSSHTQSCVTVSSFQRKKRQTLVFSATIALSADFRKKLKRGSVKSKLSDDLNSIENLSQRVGMRAPGHFWHVSIETSVF